MYIHVHLLQVMSGVSGKDHDDTAIKVFSHHSLSLPALQSNAPGQCVTYTVHYSKAMHTTLPALQSNAPGQCVTYTVHYSKAMHTTLPALQSNAPRQCMNYTVHYSKASTSPHPAIDILTGKVTPETYL